MAFYMNIVEKVKELDIGLVIINAGISNYGNFINVSAPQLEQMINVNSYQVGSMLSQFLPRLKSRKSRSGIVIVSSVGSKIPLPTCVVYSATKAFASCLGEAINFEIDSEGK